MSSSVAIAGQDSDFSRNHGSITIFCVRTFDNWFQRLGKMEFSNATSYAPRNCCPRQHPPSLSSRGECTLLRHQFRGEVLPQHDVSSVEREHGQEFPSLPALCTRTTGEPQWTDVFGGIPTYLISVSPYRPSSVARKHHRRTSREDRWTPSIPLLLLLMMVSCG